jgi:hypothetical protein
MPAPTTYTESTLAPYLALDLGDVGCVLHWDEAHPQVRQAVNDTARLLGVADVADAVEAGKVERLGAVAVWRRAVKSLGARITISEDQQRFEQGDLQKMAQASLQLAESAAAADLPEYQIRVDTLTYASGDPYAYAADSARVLP